MTMSHRSKPQRELLRFAVAAGQSTEDLRDLLWLVQAHSEIAALPRIARNVLHLLDLIPQHWEAPLGEWGLEGWPRLLTWIIEEQKTLANTSPLFDLRPKHANHNPFLYLPEGVKSVPLYSTLFSTYKDPENQERYALLQGHLLVAHMRAMREHTSRRDYEEHAGEKGWEPFQELNSPYPAALAVRDLSQGVGARHELLLRYPVHLPPVLFAEQAWQVEAPQDREVMGRHRDICAFLSKAYGLREWRVRGEGMQGNGGGSGNPIPGHIDLTEEMTLWNAPLGDQEDPDNDWGESSFLQYCPLTREQQQELLEAGDHPGENFLDETLHLTSYGKGQRSPDPSTLVTASRLQAKHVEAANQLLPWAYSVLSAGEWRQVVTGCRKWFNALPQNRSLSARAQEELEVRALLLTMIATGSPLERALQLKLLLTEGANEDGQLVFLLPGSADSSTPAPGYWRIRALEPEYRQCLDPVPGKERLRSSYVFLPDLLDTGVFLARLHREQGAHASGERTLHPSLSRPLPCFLREISWYRKRIKRLLTGWDPTGRLTETKIAGWLFSRVIRETAGDSAVTALLTAQPHPLAHVRIFYTAHSLRYLQGLYGRVISSAESVSAEGNTDRDRGSRGAVWPGSPVPEPHLSVGSRGCPLFSTVQEAVARLRRSLGAARHYTGPYGWARYHNLYTLYTVWTFCYATAMRGVLTPYLDLQEIHPETGWACLRDKGPKSGNKARLTWVPPAVLPQMVHYRDHLKAVRPSISERTPVLQEPCFLLDKDRQPLCVSPKTLAPFLQEFLPFSANVHRRFVRTELLERGCPPEVMDAWMGHWFRGEEPWGEYSTLSFAAYRRTLETFLLPFLQELGFRRLRSEL